MIASVVAKLLEEEPEHTYGYLPRLFEVGGIRDFSNKIVRFSHGPEPLCDSIRQRLCCTNAKLRKLVVSLAGLDAQFAMLK